MVTFIAGIILGGLVSWAITHAYHVRASRDQKTIFNKLTRDLRELILQDKRAHLSVSELNAILKDRTIDTSSDDSLPYKACPKCGSDNLNHSEDYDVEVEVGDSGDPIHSATPYGVIECEDCGWKDTELDKFYRGES